MRIICYLHRLTQFPPSLYSAESMSDTIVLLADDNLLLLPLESLSVFLTPRVTSLTRDFSLQFLYHRLHQSEGKNMQLHFL